MLAILYLEIPVVLIIRGSQSAFKYADEKADEMVFRNSREIIFFILMKWNKHLQSCLFALMKWFFIIFPLKSIFFTFSKIYFVLK